MSNFKKCNTYISTQIKVFTRWIKTHLPRSSVEINDITKDLSNGLILIELAQSLTSNRLSQISEKQSNETDKNEANCKLALTMFENDEVKLNNISWKDICNSNKQSILKLVWSLINRYSISNAVESIDIKKEIKSMNNTMNNFEQQLSSIKEQIKELSNILKIKNNKERINELFSKSQKDFYNITELLKQIIINGQELSDGLQECQLENQEKVNIYDNDIKLLQKLIQQTREADQVEMKRLNEEIRNLSNEINQLNEDVDRYDTRMQDNNMNIERLNHQLNITREQLIDAVDRNQQEQEEMPKIKKCVSSDVSSLDDIIEHYQDEMEKQYEEMGDLHEENHQLELRLDESIEHGQLLASKLDEIQIHDKSKIDALNNKIDILNNQIIEKNEEIDTVKKENQTIKVYLITLNKQMKKMKNIIKIANEFETLTKELTSIKQIDDFQSDMLTLQNNTTNFMKKLLQSDDYICEIIEKLNQILDLNKSANNKLNEEIKILNNQIDELNDIIRELNVQINRLDYSLSESDLKCTQAKEIAEKAVDNDEITNLRTEMNIMNENITSLTNDINKVKDSINNSFSQVIELNKTLSQTINFDNKDEIQSINDKINKLKENNNLRDQIDTINQKTQNLRSQVSQVISNVELLQNRLSDTQDEDESEELQDELCDIHNDILEMRSPINQLIADIKSLNDMSQNLQESLDYAKNHSDKISQIFINTENKEKQRIESFKSIIHSMNDEVNTMRQTLGQVFAIPFNQLK